MPRIPPDKGKLEMVSKEPMFKYFLCVITANFGKYKGEKGERGAKVSLKKLFVGVCEGSFCGIWWIMSYCEFKLSR